MPTLKKPFGQAASIQAQPEDDSRKYSGEFRVPIVNRETGEIREVYQTVSAHVFAEMLSMISIHDSATEYFDLSGKDLSGVDFSKTPGLSSAIFDGSNLSGTKFEHADIDGASFKNCNMTGADLTAAKAEDADFSGSNLTKASLRSTWAQGANFFNADLTGAETHMLNLRKAHLEFARISKEQLKKAMFADQTTHMTASEIISKRPPRRTAQLNRR